ncbi:DUF6276 family protein [Halogeometricum sp. CBA1124]|uniref:DUF6276 family protein n=1 Tax=Halogeometricum sp. CBA1124 TaxID=2668071 RepID=UPI0031B6B5FB
MRELPPSGRRRRRRRDCGIRRRGPGDCRRRRRGRDFSAVSDAFPSGRGGVALALLVGKLDSLALHRAAVETLADEAERAGADPFLTLDRLGGDDGVDPQFDFERRRLQFESLVS